MRIFKDYENINNFIKYVFIKNGFKGINTNTKIECCGFYYLNNTTCKEHYNKVKHGVYRSNTKDILEYLKKCKNEGIRFYGSNGEYKFHEFEDYVEKEKSIDNIISEIIGDVFIDENVYIIPKTKLEVICFIDKHKLFRKEDRRDNFREDVIYGLK